MTPLIIPNFNQLFYLINLINWWNYYTNNSKVYILDNKSDYKPLLKFYENCHVLWPNVEIVKFKVNNCGDNLKSFLKSRVYNKYSYYCISNPDIMPHP